MTIEIAPLTIADYERWSVLARGYKAFYETTLPDAEYERAWQRLLAEDGIYGLGAKLDDQLVGITHYLFHTSTWATEVCYLQDLFVDPEVRGQGVARALIEAVATVVRQRGSTRLYWLTQTHNTTARILYDKVAQYHDFIRYDYRLG
jgi:GNAT superfamily N-acetyltransferase